MDTEDLNKPGPSGTYLRNDLQSMISVRKDLLDIKYEDSSDEEDDTVIDHIQSEVERRNIKNEWTQIFLDPISEKVKQKVEEFLDRFLKCFLAAPFLRITQDQEEDIDSLAIYLEDVYERVLKDDYQSVSLILEDLQNVIKHSPPNPRFLYSSQDLEMIQNQLISKIEDFADELDEPLIAEKDAGICVGKTSAELTNYLKKTYKNISESLIQNKALEIVIKSKQSDAREIHKSLRKMNTSNQVKEVEIKSYNYHLPEPTDGIQRSVLVGEHRAVFIRTRNLFRQKYPQEHQKMGRTIQIITNPDHLKEYEHTRRCMGATKELFVFHGTMEDNLIGIVKSNFLIEATPTSGRQKRNAFGTGFYFSESPSKALQYGNALIVCKVLLGNCQELPSDRDARQEIPGHFDSRSIRNGRIIIVKNSDQILPYSIITLHQKSVNATLNRCLRGSSVHAVSKVETAFKMKHRKRKCRLMDLDQQMHQCQRIWMGEDQRRNDIRRDEPPSKRSRTTQDRHFQSQEKPQFFN